jgi:hypothetical protein
MMPVLVPRSSPARRAICPALSSQAGLKAAAVKACLKGHERAAAVTRGSIWSRAYIMHLSPAKPFQVPQDAP